MKTENSVYVVTAEVMFIGYHSVCDSLAEARSQAARLVAMGATDVAIDDIPFAN